MAEEYGSIYVDIGAKYQNLIAGLGVAGGLVTNWTVKAQADIDTAMRNIWTIVDTSKSRIDRLQVHLEELSRGIPQTTKQLAEGYYQVISASVELEHALYVTEVAAKAASAGLSTTYTAVDALTSVLNAYSLSANKAGVISDIMFKAVERGKMTYEQYAGSLGQVVTIAALAGISFEEVSAAMATMTRTGLSAEMAATALRGTINAFLKPADDAAAAAQALGFDLSIAALQSQGLTKTMELMLAATKGNAEAVRALIPDVRGYNGVANLMRNGVKDLAYDVNVMTNAFGASEKAFSKQADSLANKMAYMKNAANEMAIAFGKVLTPTIVKITEFMQGVTVAAAELPESTQKIILLTSALGTLAPLLIKIGTGLASLLSGPAGIVIGVGLLTAAIDMLIKKGKDWDTQAVESASKQLKLADGMYEATKKITAQRDQLENLISRYEKLKETSDTNKTAQAELQTVIAEIGKTAPSVVTAWDSIGTAVSINMDKAKTKVKELAEQQALYLEAMKKHTEMTIKSMESSIKLYDAEQKKVDALQDTLIPFFQAYKLTGETGLRDAVNHLNLVAQSSITNVINLWAGASTIAKEALKKIALEAANKFYEGRDLATFKTKEELQALMFDMQTMIRQYGPLETSLDARELELLGFKAEVEKLKTDLLTYDLSIEGLRKSTQTITTGTGKQGEEKELNPLAAVSTSTSDAEEKKQRLFLERIAQAELRSKVLTDEAEYYLDIITKQLDITKLNSEELNSVLNFIRDLRLAYGDLFVNIGRADELDAKTIEVMKRQIELAENAKKTASDLLIAQSEEAIKMAEDAEASALRVAQNISQYVKDSITEGTFTKEIGENWRAQFEGLLSIYAQFPSVVEEVYSTTVKVNQAIADINTQDSMEKQQKEIEAAQRLLENFNMQVQETETANTNALELAKRIADSAIAASQASGATSKSVGAWISQLKIAEEALGSYPEALMLVIETQNKLSESMDILKESEIAKQKAFEEEQIMTTQRIYEREIKIRQAYREKLEAELKAQYEASLETAGKTSEQSVQVVSNVLDGINALTAASDLSLASIDSYQAMLTGLLGVYSDIPEAIGLILEVMSKLDAAREKEIARITEATNKIYGREIAMRKAYLERRAIEEQEAYDKYLSSLTAASEMAIRLGKAVTETISNALRLPEIKTETLESYRESLNNLLETYADIPEVVEMAMAVIADLDLRLEENANKLAEATEKIYAREQAMRDAYRLRQEENAAKLAEATEKLYAREEAIRKSYYDRKTAEEQAAYEKMLADLSNAQNEAMNTAKNIIDSYSKILETPDISTSTVENYMDALNNLLSIYAEYPEVISLVIASMTELDAKTQESQEYKEKLKAEEEQALFKAQNEQRASYETDTASRITEQIKELTANLNEASIEDLDFMKAQLEVIIASYGDISEIVSSAILAEIALEEKKYEIIAENDRKAAVEIAERAAWLQGLRYAGAQEYYAYLKEKEEELLVIEERRLELYQAAAKELAPKASGIITGFGDMLKSLAIDKKSMTGQEGLQEITNILAGFTNAYFGKIFEIMSKEEVSLSEALDGVNSGIASQLLKTGTVIGKSLIEVGDMLQSFAADYQGTALGNFAGGIGSGSKSVGGKFLEFLGVATELIGPILETVAVVGAIFQAVMFVINLIVSIVNFFKGQKEREEQEQNKPGLQISDITGTMADKIVIALDPLKALYSLPTYVKEIKEAIYSMRDSVLSLLSGGTVAASAAQGGIVYNINAVNIFASDSKTFNEIMSSISKEARLAEVGVGA